MVGDDSPGKAIAYSEGEEKVRLACQNVPEGVHYWNGIKTFL